jgi:hypothetical protein
MRRYQFKALISKPYDSFRAPLRNIILGCRGFIFLEVPPFLDHFE